MMAPNTKDLRRRAQRPRHDRAVERIDAYAWRHNTAQEVRADLVCLDGRWYADFRKYLNCGPDHWLATAKGVTIPLGELDHLELAVRRLRTKARERGL